MLAFDRVPAGEVMYANPNAELYMVPLGSAPGAGAAIRLAANDPVQCTGLTSPGINNHYPCWATAAPAHNGRTYYGMAYASNRADIPAVTSRYDGVARPITQIYLTAVTIEDGVYTTHGSIYVWWQPQTLNTRAELDLPDWQRAKTSMVSPSLRPRLRPTAPQKVPILTMARRLLSTKSSNLHHAQWRHNKGASS